MLSTGPVYRGLDPYFCKEPLIRYDFRFPNLQNKGPTETVTNFIIFMHFYAKHIFVKKIESELIRDSGH